jgi:hypothetical protein
MSRGVMPERHDWWSGRCWLLYLEGLDFRGRWICYKLIRAHEAGCHTYIVLGLFEAWSPTPIILLKAAESH